MRRFASALVALGGLWVARAAHTQPPPAAPPAAPPAEAAPDLEFLEYLGSWQADDEEWLVIQEGEKNSRTKDRSKQPPERKPERPRNEDDEGK